MKSRKSRNKQIPKISTGIKGLDSILHGGFPKNRTVLLRGKPGSGKTIISLEFLYRGALDNIPGIFIGFEETTKDIIINGGTLGWDLGALEKENRLAFIQALIPPESILSGDFSIQGLLTIAAAEIKRIKAKRIVFDALDVLLRLFDSPTKARAEIHLLNEWIKKQKVTSVVTIKPELKSGAGLLEEFFESMSDCVIDLDTRYYEQIPTRRLRILKYRGSSFERNEYPYSITKGGAYIFPITNMELDYKLRGDRISTGIEQLDEMLEGGIFQGSTLLYSGLPGTGKTLFSCKFIQANCSRESKILFFGFEESEENIIKNVSSAGINLKPFVKNGSLKFLTTFPESLGSEEHLVNLINKVDELKPKHLIIDSISACYRMGGSKAAFDFLVRVLNFTKERGITLIMLNQMSGDKNVYEISGNNISSMIDIVIFLNYHDYAGHRDRVLYILKTRGSGHSNMKMEFKITDEGIELSNPIIENDKMLTGYNKEAHLNRELEEIKYIDERILFLQNALAKIDRHSLKDVRDISNYNRLMNELSDLFLRRGAILMNEL